MPNGLAGAYAAGYLAEVRQDGSNNIMLDVLKKLDELSGANSNLTKKHEKELSISTAAAHQAKRKELEEKFQTYPPDHKTQADVKAEYETDFQLKYDAAVEVFHANPTHSFVPPREVGDLFAYDGMKTYGWNTTLENGKGNIDRQNVLKYDKEVHLADFETKIYQIPYSKNIDVYGTMHNFLDFGIQIGLNKVQMGELIKQFIKEYFPARYPGIRNTTNAQELFVLALNLVNWNDMALKAKQAIKAIERRPKDSLSSVVHTFSTLRRELFEYTNPAWDTKKIEERAEIATLGILQDLVSRDNADFLRSVKQQARENRMEISLSDQIALLTKQELKPGFALEKTKSLAHYDPNISRELDSSSKIESVLNHVVAMADTRLEDGVRKSSRANKGKPATKYDPGDRKGKGTGAKPKAPRSSRPDKRRQGQQPSRDSSPSPSPRSGSPSPIRERTQRSPSTRRRSTSPETSDGVTRSPSPAAPRRRTAKPKSGNRNKDKAHRPGAGSSRKQAPTKTTRTQPTAVPRPPSPQHGLSSTEHSTSNATTPSHSRPSSSERRACYLCGQASHGWRHCNIYRNYTQTEERPCETCGKGFHKSQDCSESGKYKAKVSKSGKK